jgi:hypothetical protein
LWTKREDLGADMQVRSFPVYHDGDVGGQKMFRVETFVDIISEYEPEIRIIQFFKLS